MTALTHTPTTTAPDRQTTDISLEMRLAATEAAMTVRLAEAAVAYEVNTAHLPTTPVDLADVITAPVVPAAEQLPDLYPTPVAAFLQRAHHRLTTAGWCAGAMIDEYGALCLYGAIRIEAGGDQCLEQRGLDVLMDAIRRKFPDAESVPTFNDAFGGPAVPLRLLGQAADLADARGI